MKYLSAIRAITILLLHVSMNLSAQDSNELTRTYRNSIHVYVGVFEYNVSYERNIIKASKFNSSIRLGYGYGMFLTAGEGKYINPAFVQLIGKRNSHLEIDLGIKYMLTNSITNPDFLETFIPDIFLGYRFEKPTGGFVFRAGIAYPTLFNAGVGYKF